MNVLSAHFRFALVEKFSHGYPSMQTIRAYFSKLGLRGAYTIGVININHILINLSNEEELSRPWLKQIILIDGFPMTIFKWSPDFNPKIESPITPVWARLPKLPVHLLQKKALFGIASLIGVLLKLDEAIANGVRPSLARVCIKLNLLEERPDTLWIGCKGKFVQQCVVYERCPSYYSKCQHFGHDEKECRERIEPETQTNHSDDLRNLITKCRDRGIKDKDKEEHVVQRETTSVQEGTDSARTPPVAAPTERKQNSTPIQNATHANGSNKNVQDEGENSMAPLENVLPDENDAKDHNIGEHPVQAMAETENKKTCHPSVEYNVDPIKNNTDWNQTRDLVLYEGDT
ncbi:UNVERIFIED_CONTAM: hypothetical protein Slati_2748600 [Sesamum latifolium]|uniref:DUF4283 domain-containing protein n=1 Tax=Sesamum latifolium TaxID=2727402 RepID=A0AAW2VXS8_9LAMI